jgi:phosphoribosylformylglycinamidine synthase
MATATGGARIDLMHAPLKYPGLQPWEILISEAQERMTLAVPPERLGELLALARRREVEASVLGEFTASGRLEVVYGAIAVADLPLEFLHDGLPRTRLPARLQPPRAGLDAAARARLGDEATLGERVLDLLDLPELSCGEARARAYDHEVKGLSVIKPWIGVRRDVPATATVMRARHGRREGVVLGEGIHPFYADLDAREMARACVDEAVRRVLCAGARIDRIAALDNFCWPDPVQSDRTPDGAHKLAQLVRCCQGLHDACVALGVPLVSGKDSMKNDAVLGGVKISIPPTLLVSAMGQIDDVARALDLRPRPGDALWLLGVTKDELGATSVARRAGAALGGSESARLGEVPRTDLAAAAARYAAFAAARDAGLVGAAHVTSRGGLAIALVHMALSCELAIEVDLDEVGDGLDAFAALFSESTGRIVIAAGPGDEAALRQRLAAHGLVSLGRAGEGGEAPLLRVRRGGRALFDLPTALLRERFHATLADL